MASHHHRATLLLWQLTKYNNYRKKSTLNCWFPYFKHVWAASCWGCLWASLLFPRGFFLQLLKERAQRLHMIIVLQVGMDFQRNTHNFLPQWEYFYNMPSNNVRRFIVKYSTEDCNLIFILCCPCLLGGVRRPNCCHSSEIKCISWADGVDISALTSTLNSNKLIGVQVRRLSESPGLRTFQVFFQFAQAEVITSLHSGAK